MAKFAHVDYDSLDKAKNAFIASGRATLKFPKNYGFALNKNLGASSNVFSLNLKPFLKHGAKNLFVSLLPEGLGTADDARPADLTPAELKRFWHNIGIKTVAVMTNDAAASGLQTVLISLYLPSSTPEKVFDKYFMEGFLGGFTEGCRQVGCAYISGETPQLKNKICEGKLDIAGAVFAVCPPGKHPIMSKNIKAGDKIVFVESSGPHENGFTTLRELAGRLPRGYRTRLPSGIQYWEAINRGSKLYTPFVMDLLKAEIMPTNIEPITGHGWQKLMRAGGNFAYVIEKILPVPEVFKFAEKALGLTPAQMIKVFNYGVGYAVFVRGEKAAQAVVKIAEKNKLKAVVAGHVERSQNRQVIVKPLNIVLKGDRFILIK